MSAAAASQYSSPTSTRLRPVRLLTEAGLARRAAAGDTAAFAEIYRRHHQAIYRFCRSMLVSAEDASDALQSTMAAALRALPGERRAIDLRPWLFCVARNECITLLRGRRPTAGLEAVESLPAPSSGEDAVAVRGRLRELVGDLQALPERQRSALVMRELSGLDYEAIAVALETTAATAKQVVYEARRALHELAEGRSMLCEAVRRTLSDGDGRVRRGRKLRSHLRACSVCNAFALAIGRRGADLALLAPPLPAPVPIGIISSLLGVKAGGSGGATLAGGTVATGISGTLKGAAVVAATVAIGAGGYGVVDRIAEPDSAPRPQPSSIPRETSAPTSRAEGRDGAAGAARNSARRGVQPTVKAKRGRGGSDVIPASQPAAAGGTGSGAAPAGAVPGGGEMANRPASAPAPTAIERPTPAQDPPAGGAPTSSEDGRPAGGAPAAETPAGSVIEDRPTQPDTTPSGSGSAPAGPGTAPTSPVPAPSELVATPVAPAGSAG